MAIKRFTPDWHFQLIERILRHVICVQFVHFPYDDIHIGLVRFREEEKLSARECLEAGQAEMGRFEDFDACSLVGWNAKGGWCQRFGDCVDTRMGQRQGKCRLAKLNISMYP